MSIGRRAASRGPRSRGLLAVLLAALLPFLLDGQASAAPALPATGGSCSLPNFGDPSTWMNCGQEEPTAATGNVSGPFFGKCTAALSWSTSSVTYNGSGWDTNAHAMRTAALACVTTVGDGQPGVFRLHAYDAQGHACSQLLIDVGQASTGNGGIGTWHDARPAPVSASMDQAAAHSWVVPAWDTGNCGTESMASVSGDYLVGSCSSSCTSYAVSWSFWGHDVDECVYAPFPTSNFCGQVQPWSWTTPSQAVTADGSAAFTVTWAGNGAPSTVCPNGLTFDLIGVDGQSVNSWDGERDVPCPTTAGGWSHAYSYPVPTGQTVVAAYLERTAPPGVAGPPATVLSWTAGDASTYGYGVQPTPAPTESQQPGSDVGGPIDAQSGCHFYNPLCWLAAAIVPHDLGSLWSSLRASVASHAPWNYILAGPTFVADIVSGLGGSSSGGGQSPHAVSGGCVGGAGSDGLPGLDCVDPWKALQPGDGSGAFSVATMRAIAATGLGIAFAWACYHRAKRLIGDQGPNDPGNADIEESVLGDPAAFSADFAERRGL